MSSFELDDENYDTPEEVSVVAPNPVNEEEEIKEVEETTVDENKSKKRKKRKAKKKNDDPKSQDDPIPPKLAEEPLIESNSELPGPSVEQKPADVVSLFEINFENCSKVDIGTVMGKFTPEQESVYEAYRRSNFKSSSFSKLAQTIAGCPVNDKCILAMRASTKVLVGEIAEKGRQIMREKNEDGPLRPSHIREAYRRLREEEKVPIKFRPPLFS